MVSIGPTLAPFFSKKKGLERNSKKVGFPLIFVGLWVWWTTHYGGKEDLEELLKGGGDVNVNETNPDDEGSTPLFTAAEYNKVGCAELLIKEGANLETPDTEGRSPLWIAAQGGHKAMVQLLLDRGANFEAANKKGATPLFIAVEYGHEDVVKILLEKGAVVGAENKKGNTPLTKAAAHENDEMIKILLVHADVDAVNSGVLTPLFVAAKKGHPGVVQASFGVRSGIVCGSFGGRSAVVRGPLENFSKTFRIVFRKIQKFTVILLITTTNNIRNL